MSTNIWVWVAALLSLCIFSFLYKDNPFYKFAEHLFIGVSVGASIAWTWHLVVIPVVWVPLKQHQWITILPMCLGLLMWLRFTKRYGWLSLITMSFIIGAGTGISIPLTFQASIFRQLQNTMLTTAGAGFNAEYIGKIVTFIGVIATLIYFFFSLEHKGVIGAISKVGIYYIMFGFGASFGYTVMARLSLLIGRLQFLLHDWLGIMR